MEHSSMVDVVSHHFFPTVIHEFNLDIDTLEYTLTTEGYEFTIDENYDSSDYIYVTLDDTSSDQNSAIINLTQEDGVDQTINILDIDGIEDVTLNVIDDILNTTDDLISIDKLIINDTQTLNIHSQESIEINNIISKKLFITEKINNYKLLEEDLLELYNYMLNTDTYNFI